MIVILNGNNVREEVIQLIAVDHRLGLGAILHGKWGRYFVQWGDCFVSQDLYDELITLWECRESRQFQHARPLAVQLPRFWEVWGRIRERSKSAEQAVYSGLDGAPDSVGQSVLRR